MLETQKFIMENGIEALATIGVDVKSKGDLFILNYNMIDAPKTHPVVMECRGLCLDSDFNVKAIAFPRFFNVGEFEEHTNTFNWNNFSVCEKLDGSLIKIFTHNGELQIQTRGSFADSELIPNKTWEQAVRECLTADQIQLMLDCDRYAFIFEYCSPYNQVVRQYDEPHLVLLTINRISEGDYVEADVEHIDYCAKVLRFKRPNNYHFKTLDAMKVALEKVAHTDPTFEGYVIQDNNGMRLKLKSLKYVELHHMAGNGNLYLTKNLLPFILDNETDEVLTYFPSAKERIDVVQGEVDRIWHHLVESYNAVKYVSGSQKDFALAVHEQNEPLSCLLFQIKRDGLIDHQDELAKRFRASANLLLKIMKG